MTTQRDHGRASRDKPTTRHPFLAALAGWRYKKICPLWLRRLIKQRVLPYDEYMTEVKRLQGPGRDVEEVSSYPPRADATLGIIKERWSCHLPYIAACREMGVAYRVVDIAGPDWLDAVRQSPCDAFLVWPSGHLTVLKRMYEERLGVMARDLGKVLYPSYEEVMLYESKRRGAYWMEAHEVPHARTRVFYSREEAAAFAQTAGLPIVAKTDLGATASGVRVFRGRDALVRFVNRVFRKGIRQRHGDLRDRQWGVVLLQDYLPDVAEWRVIRMNRSYFAYQKGKEGDFHSGSHEVIFADPPRALLDLVRVTTDKGGFTSMALDVFQTPRGEFFVNELHTVFGRDPWDHQMEVDGKPGRYVYDQAAGTWAFQEGIYTQNSCCNLRVGYVLEQLLGKGLPAGCEEWSSKQR